MRPGCKAKGHLVPDLPVRRPGHDVQIERDAGRGTHLFECLHGCNVPGIGSAQGNRQDQAIGMPCLRQKLPGACVVLLRWGKRGIVGLARSHVVVFGRFALATMRQFQ